MCGHSSWEVGWAIVGLVLGLSAPGPLPHSLPTPVLSCGPGSATTLLSGLGWGPGAPSPSWEAWVGKSRAPGLRAPGQCHGLPGFLSLSSLLRQPAPTKSTLLFVFVVLISLMDLFALICIRNTILPNLMSRPIWQCRLPLG